MEKEELGMVLQKLWRVKEIHNCAFTYASLV